MFAGLGWKRQRRDDVAVECAALASSPASVDAPNTPSGSTCGSDCGSETGELMHGGLRLALAGSASSSDAGSDAGSLELTACSPSTRAAACGPRAADLAGVRAKAAYFEALIRSNTTAYVQCGMTSGSQHDLSGAADGGDGAAAAGQASALMCLDEEVEAAAGSGAPGGRRRQEDVEEVAFDEVTVVLRVPRGRQQRQQQAAGGGGAEPAHERYGTAAQMAQLIERLSEQLSVAERERVAAMAAAARRAAEVDNLQRVVRELTESRAKAVAARVTLAERHADLQAEYHRMLRIADLSRTVSKENIAKTSRTQQALKAAELELHAARRQADSLAASSAEVKSENLVLKERMALLERLECFEEACESVCMRQISRYSLRVTETY